MNVRPDQAWKEGRVRRGRPSSRSGPAEFWMKVWGWSILEREWEGLDPQGRYAARVEEGLVGVPEHHRESLGLKVLETVLEGFASDLGLNRSAYPSIGSAAVRKVDDPSPAAFIFLTVENALRTPAMYPKENNIPVFGANGEVVTAGWEYLAIARHVYVEDRPVSQFAHPCVNSNPDRVLSRVLKHVTHAFEGSEHDEKERSIAEQWAAVVGQRIRHFSPIEFVALLNKMPAQAQTFSNEPGETESLREQRTRILRRYESDPPRSEDPLWLDTAS